MKDEFVKQYFKDTAKEFDEIYDNSGSILKRLINKAFRNGMHERVTKTLKICQGNNKTLLDIGCGSGRIALLLAEKGIKIKGIDYSSEMIDLAKVYLEKYKSSTSRKLNVEFICCDFLHEFNNKELFDITLALGVFDYVKYPIPLLEKMKKFTKEKIIASYPARFTFQTPIRKVWLWTKSCPSYFYTENKIKHIYNSVGISNYEIIKISAGYLVKANISKE